MARFRGTVQGNRSEASRLGHSSGLVTTAHGWDVGIRVECKDDGDGNDVLLVYLDGGSHDADDTRYLGAARFEAPAPGERKRAVFYSAVTSPDGIIGC